MSTVDKKTLAGLLLGIGAFALAAKKGSRSYFPEPTGKAPKGPDGAFTEEQDEIFFAFKQNAPTKSISTKFGPDLDARRQLKQRSSRLDGQLKSKQTAVQNLQNILSQDNFGDATAIAQMQNEVNSIQAQIDNANNLVSTMNMNLAMDSDDAAEIAQWQAEKEAAEQQLEDAEQRLLAVKEILPQSQKTRMQAQVASISAQMIDINKQLDKADRQLVALQDKIRTDSASGDSYTLEEYFNEHSERGYTDEAKARYGAGSPGEAAWENWEKQMDLYRGYGNVPQKFTGEQTDTSSIMGQGFKTGVTPLDPQGAFSGDVDNSDPFAPKEFSLPKFK